ncbi:SusC/RagA family TonB-linked outer membrane protein [Pseudoflavitalea sp. X16]|uniref:SusC/RagA family TonB-linked outer membrane protein n=1 Tax=Paraflavitalea devenefica TaxID=2716334 RepID=UPI00141E341C|nr:SusC/RagA family TonB-linked outer membrane protein [Paraflavitalea devenefica]NII24020.1 SusC/RagA family TonB-linked outer membrane protein [Paraflavitalea devenefica]
MRKAILSLLCVALGLGQLSAQTRMISGKVTDSKGAPIPNASVLEKGTSTGTVTKDDGTYSLGISQNARILVISSIGMAPQEVSIGSKNVINATLQPVENSLTEVVVVGYQTLKRSEVAGAVATVGGKELAQKPIGNFTQLLQGKATGVQVTGQSGRPGAAGYIRVRGTGSINASNEPLILLDGIPISSVSYSLLNPNDIDDVNILKDAASQAIYGSRAANGVIVITSKKGRGKPEIRYSFQYGRSKAQELKNIDLMNSRQKLEYEFGAGQSNPILDSMITNRVTAGALPAGSTLFNLTPAQREALWSLAESRGAGDWGDYLLQDGTLTSHEIAVSGSGEKVKYYFSLNKSDNEGVSYGSFWNKTGGRLNVEYNALDWFKIGTNTGVTYSKENNVRSLFNTQSAYMALFAFNPYEPVRMPDGTYNNTHTGYSPIEGTDKNPSLLNRLSTFSTFYGEAKFFDHLTLRSQVGINYNTLQQENYLMPGSNLAAILGYNQKGDAGNWDFTYVVTNTAAWQQTLADVHSFTVMAGQEFTKNKFYSWSLAGRAMPTPDVNTVDNAGSAQTATTSRSDWALSSFFGNISYDYDKKYFLTLSGRRDGSSRFGANKRYANFWAVGASWDILKENFIKVDFISALRLRASIGTAGTVPSGLYDNLPTYTFTTKYRDLPSAIPLRLENADLTWEENKNYDLGLDFGFLNNRITGSFDFYNKKTNGLIYPKNVSLTTGFANYASNIGTIRNSGYEISLNGDLIRRKDLTVSLFAKYTNNDNKVLDLYSDNVPQTLSRFKEGEPLYTYFMVRWAGVNPANGKNLYYKADGSLTETYAASDAVLLSGKSPNVKFYGSFGANVSYKGFDLSAEFYYSGGNYIMNYIYQNGASDGESIADNQFTDATNYWKKPGDVVPFANLNDRTQRVTYDTDKYLEKGDYVSLRDVTLGYTMPAAIAQKLKFVKSIRLYTQGTNLWIGTKFRGLPEVGEANGESTLVSPGLYNLYAQPQLRAITFGIDVRF